MKPIVYEVKRTFTSKFVIIMMIAIIGFTALISYEVGSTYNPAPVSNAISLSDGYYISGTNATIVSYVHDSYGTPQSNITVHASIQGQSYEAVTNSAGFANITVPIQLTARNIVELNYTYRIFGLPVSTAAIPVPISSAIPYTGYQYISGIRDRTNTSNLGFQLMYIGPNGTTAPQTSVYVGEYSFSNPVSSSEIAANSSSYKVAASGFTVLTVFPTVNLNHLHETYGAALTTSNGTVLNPTPQYLGPISVYSALTQTELQGLVFEATALLGYLIPILGIFAAYLTYGKDRTTGVLESVLKRPVSRSGLISSRFSANAASIVIAVVVSMIVGDLMIAHYLSMYLSTNFMLYLIWTYVVEGIAFMSLSYMFSHLVTSQGALLGISIALYVVFGIFWQIIPAVIMLALGVPSTSSAHVLGTIIGDYVSPAGYSNIVQILFTKTVGATSANPASFGVVPWIVITVGVAWMVVPFITAFFLAKNRD